MFFFVKFHIPNFRDKPFQETFKKRLLNSQYNYHEIVRLEVQAAHAANSLHQLESLGIDSTEISAIEELFDKVCEGKLPVENLSQALKNLQLRDNDDALSMCAIFTLTLEMVGQACMALIGAAGIYAGIASAVSAIGGPAGMVMLGIGIAVCGLALLLLGAYSLYISKRYICNDQKKEINTFIDTLDQLSKPEAQEMQQPISSTGPCINS